MSNRISIRIIALILSVSMIIPVLSGCMENNNRPDGEGSVHETSDTETGMVPGSSDTEGEVTSGTSAEDIVEPVKLMNLSTNWNDYVGDMETFVYGLLISLLECQYDVFPAVVELLDGMEVYGLAYTDYSECYANDEQTKYCFTAGFIPFCGESEIPEEDFNSGLPLRDLDYQNDEASFILKYMSDPFWEHCVVYGQYLKYGVDENGMIAYEAVDYTPGQCDESLGTLYSYDEQRCLMIDDVGQYVPVTGLSLSDQLDYTALEREINAILETQDTNFETVDVVSTVYFAQEAVTSYFLSMQEELFLGYSVDLLIEAIKQLDPTECLRIGPNGLTVMDIEPMPEEEEGAGALTKWLVGTGCVIATAAGLVESFLGMECPAIAALGNASIGTAIELFMQIVVDGETLSDIDWIRIAITAVTVATSAFVNPYMRAAFPNDVVYFFADSTLDGIIAGIEQAVYAWLDKEDAKAIGKSFGKGFAIGFAVSAAFKVVGAGVEKAFGAAAAGIQKQMPKLSKRVGSFADKAAKPLMELKKKADASIFHSKYIGDKMVDRQITRIIAKGDKRLEKQAFDPLSVNGILDVNGNPLTKKELKDIFEKATDGSVIGIYNIDGEIVQIKKLNGIASIFFDETKYTSVQIDFVADRDMNFLQAAEALKKEWLNDPSLIPESIARGIRETGIALEDMDPQKIKSIIQKSDMVLHENADLKTISLVPRALHDKANDTGISHMGGFGLLKYLKEHMGHEFFDRIIQAVPTWTSHIILRED